MISGSVAVEGQGRSLLGQPASEFLRPLPRPPYTRYVSQAQQHMQHQAQQQQLASRHRSEDEPPSAAPSYPPVPGAFPRFFPHTLSPYYNPYQPPPFAPAAPPAPPPPLPRSPPRGKEGSLKHRLLGRAATPGRFSRGALIQLGGGQLRRVEDMRTEDFLLSAERSPELRLAESTVVQLLRRPATDTVTMTLSYSGNRAQVEMDTPVEHPFFVYGHGWASCSPERTLQCYGLTVNRLQVGDVCVSLIKREPPIQQQPPQQPHLPPPPPPAPYGHHQQTSATIVTTSTTTAMTARPTDAPQSYPENLSLREDSRKRRWSAPDIGDEKAPRMARTMRH